MLRLSGISCPTADTSRGVLPNTLLWAEGVAVLAYVHLKINAMCSIISTTVDALPLGQMPTSLSAKADSSQF